MGVNDIIKKFDNALNSLYWNEREKGLLNNLGKKAAINLACKLIKSSEKKNIKLLEVGCGEGHILGNIHNSLKNVINFKDICGIDKDEDILNIAKQKYSYANFNLVNVLDDDWDDSLTSYDYILCINVLHEIFSAIRNKGDNDIDIINGKKKIECTIGKLSKLLNKGGILIIFDGIEYYDNAIKEIEFSVLNESTEKLLFKFINTVHLKLVLLNKLKNINIYLTKLSSHAL
jgi:cyclopropane fatty-acyl-phospholipid synthase-like methyltransferase